MGGYERESAPWALDAAAATPSRPTSTAGCWRRTGTGSSRSRRAARARVPAMADVGIARLINGPEAFTPDNEFCLGETEVRGLLRRRRVLRARHRRRGRHRPGDGRVDRRRRADDGPVAHGRPPVRRAVPLAALHAGALARDLRDLLRHPVPRTTSGRPGAAAVSPRLRAGTRRTARCSARSPAGSGSNYYARERRGGRRGRCGRAAGRAGTGRRRSAPSTSRPARRRRCSTSRRSPSSRSTGPGAAELLEWVCDNDVARDVGAVTYTQALNARGGIECDFTVTRPGRRRVPRSSPAPRSAPTTSPGSRSHAPRDGVGADARRHRRAGPASALWGPRWPATCSAPR